MVYEGPLSACSPATYVHGQLDTGLHALDKTDGILFKVKSIVENGNLPMESKYNFSID